MSECKCACCRKKHRTEAERRRLANRLARVEGQVRGIRAMLDSDTYCTDILTQVSAAQSALASFSKELLAEHIKTCVADGVRNGDEAIVDELVETVRRMTK